MKNIKSYSEIIQDLSEEIGISTEDTKSLVDVALSSVDIKKINYFVDLFIRLSQRMLLPLVIVILLRFKLIYLTLAELG